jgi:putative membrane protein
VFDVTRKRWVRPELAPADEVAAQVARCPSGHYDRLGPIAQGFVPAILVHELVLRTSPLRPGRWLFVLVTATCLAFSACYEFFEWWAALAGGHAADAFLGTQGDVWDTQWDSFLALVGAIVSQVTLGRVHDRGLQSLAQRTP